MLKLYCWINDDSLSRVEPGESLKAQRQQAIEAWRFIYLAYERWKQSVHNFPDLSDS